MLRLTLCLLFLCLAPMSTHSQESLFLYALSYSPNGDYIAGVGNRVVIWDGTTGGVLAEIDLPLQTSTSLLLDAAWSPDSDRLAVVGTDRKVRFLDLSDDAQPFGALLAEFEATTFLDVSSIAWSQDGSFIVVGGYSTRPKLEFWDAITYGFLRESPYILGADRMAWHPDQQRNTLAVTSRGLNGALLVNTTEDAGISPIWLCSYCAPDAIALPLAWNNAGTLLVIGHNDGSIFVVDAETDTVVTSMQTSEGVRGLAWTNDDQFVLSMSRAGLQVWDSMTGTLLNDPTSINAGLFAINPIDNRVFNFYNDFNISVFLSIYEIITPNPLPATRPS